jgi:hypothetical protein
VSYAHANFASAHQLIDSLNVELSASKRFNYSIWSDACLVVGENWKSQIIDARNACNFGLLLVSPSFLSSKFILEEELPPYVEDNALPSIPVMLQKVDFERHDLKGLESRQIFSLNYEGSYNQKSYYDCNKKRRKEFVFKLFQSIEDKLSLSL